MLKESAALRILSTRESMIDAAARRQICVDELAAANQSLKDRRETEDKAIDDITAARASGDQDARNQAGDRLAEAAGDRKRADDTRELCDRKAKQSKRLYGELEERMLNTIDRVFGLGEHGQMTMADQGDDQPNAWERVELADLMGETFAQPFVGGGTRTVLDAKKALERRGEKMLMDADEKPLASTLIQYLAATVGGFLDKRGVQHGIAFNAEAALPEAPEKVEPVKDEELESAQEEARERASRHGPNAAKTKRTPRGSYSPEVAALVPDVIQQAKDRGKRKPAPVVKKKTGKKKAKK